LNLLRFIAWTALLIIVVSIAYAVFAGREYTSPQPLQVAKPLWFAPSYEYRPICTDNIYIDPWIVVNYFGLSVENNKIVYKYTNTSEEAEKVLNNASIDPELYYYYYSILTALVAIPKSNYSTVYDLHPLPVSQNDAENITQLSLCTYLPNKGFYVPPVNASIVSNTSYVVRNGSIINIITYLPIASIAILNSTSYANPINVSGFATGSLSAERVGEVVCGSTSAYFADYNKTGYIIYVCSAYRVSYNYTLGYIANGTQVATDIYSNSFDYVARHCIDCEEDVASAVGGYYKGFGPLAKAVITARSYYAYSEEQIINGTPHLYEYYYASFSTNTYTRALKLYRATATISASLGKILGGVIGTMRAVALSNGSAIELPANLTKPLLNINISAYPWEPEAFNASVYLSDTVSIVSSRIINFTRMVKVASINVSISKPVADLSMYPWGSAIDAKPVVDVRTWGIKEPSINITRIQQLLTPNPGETWLEKLVLRYIHDEIKQFINSNSAMNQYLDAYMWLLSAQIPANMGNCPSHNTAKPLLDALCGKCGSEVERVSIVRNVTGYSLNAWIRNISLYYPSYNTTAINATVCIARISNYPELWNLYNTSIDRLYALPADNGYLVLYNIYENSPFGDWRRVKQ
jgi:hypothetical protein